MPCESDPEMGVLHVWTRDLPARQGQPCDCGLSTWEEWEHDLFAGDQRKEVT